MNPNDEFVSWDFRVQLHPAPAPSDKLSVVCAAYDTGGGYEVLFNANPDDKTLYQLKPMPFKIVEVNPDGTVWARISNAEEVLRADDPVHPTDHTPGKG